MWVFTCTNCGISVADDDNARWHQRVKDHVCPTDVWKDIIEFHKKFDFVIPNSPELLPEDLLEFRIKFMQEELNEFIDAHNNNNLHDVADALVDLVYVAIGTARLMGIPFNLCWDEVQRANMTKVRATSKDQSKRNTIFDVVKPEGWVPPDHSKHIKSKGE